MIRFNKVRKTYPNGTQALRGLSFELKDGEFAFLVGPSGAGKSTILSLVTAEEPLTGGHLMVNGYNLNTIRPRQVPYLRRSLGIVFQDFRLIEKKTVYENLAFAMRVIGASSREMHRRIPYVLELVGLKDKQRRHPSELSGGEQQRVAIARALVNNPTTIIADEPTGNLDPERSLEIMQLLEAINALGTTMLVVTHEQSLVNQFHKRVIHIEDGRVVSDEENGTYRYVEEDDEDEDEDEPSEVSRPYVPAAAPDAGKVPAAADEEIKESPARSEDSGTSRSQEVVEEITENSAASSAEPEIRSKATAETEAESEIPDLDVDVDLGLGLDLELGLGLDLDLDLNIDDDIS